MKVRLELAGTSDRGGVRVTRCEPSNDFQDEAQFFLEKRTLKGARWRATCRKSTQALALTLLK